MEIDELLAAQKTYFATGATLPVRARKEALVRLLRAVEQREDVLARALFDDLGKSPTECYMSEIGLLKKELRCLIRRVGVWAKPRRAHTPLFQQPAKCTVLPCPYGTVLIMSPWNYPLLLTLEPLADALAAGNTALVKPSAYAPATSAAVARLLRAVFDPSLVAVVEGGREANAALLDRKFDSIFFTGSVAVGRLVLARAAESLTPVTLELGGKSPCIVDQTADLSVAARRIVFGKLLNCGQTCVAPDYVLVEESVKDELLAALRGEIVRQYGDALQNPDYGRIVNSRHYERLRGLIPDAPYLGGRGDGVRIEPTVFEADASAPAMQEEIFGPLLPVLSYRTREEALATIALHPTPLALYLFSRDKRAVEFFTSRVSFGGGCVNDCVMHLATSSMGFGGVGTSGMGAYHGKTGFDTFTHYKSILKKPFFGELQVRYRPHTPQKTRTIRRFL